jgi:hypothetical protein|tara:strand:+ start:469 stop:798 length:330 start_codon:yes stop_codon:yes gene_type:complete
MSEVKIVRLQTGEEIIGKVTENNDDTITLSNPAIIIPAGEGRIGIAPYLPYCDDEELKKGLELSKHHVIFIVAPIDEFLNQYNNAFGSGLIIPETSGVVGAVPELKLTE